MNYRLVPEMVDRYFAWARERYQIKLRREAGLPREKWTQDPIFKQYRFCNVHREDDKVTRWFRENVRNPLRSKPEVFMATVLFRWFNTIRTGEALFVEKAGIAVQTFFERYLECDDIFALERQIYKYCGDGPYVTGAYMIKTPAGLNKVRGVLQCVDAVYQDWEHLATRIEPGETTMQGVWERLCEYPYLGSFMSFQVVADLQHTDLLCKAPDRMTWAATGPGSQKGLSRLFGQPEDYFDRNNAEHRAIMLDGMRELLLYSKMQQYWPQEWTPWDMSVVQSTCCELQKYWSAQEGKRQKRNFTPAEELR